MDDSLPEGSVPLDSILCTEELSLRPQRPPDYQKENRALVTLAATLADSRANVLQTLAETILEIIECDSAGISLLTKEDGGKRFYWPAIAGLWKPHVGGGTPRDFGPCGDVLDRNRTLLFRHFERRYPYLIPVSPPAAECLLVPFYVAGKAVGTIWAITHNDLRKFDGEDERVLNSLGQFASLAYQTLDAVDDLKLQISARAQAEASVRQLASGLENRFRRLVDANIIGIFLWNLDGRITGANGGFLRIVGYNRDDLAGGNMRWTDLTPPEWHGRDDRAIGELGVDASTQPYEKEFFRKNGSRVPVLVGGALFEPGGQEGVGFVLDLSEQKRAESAMRRSEGYLAEAQRLTRSGSWAWDVRAGSLFWSRETFRIYERDPERNPTWDEFLAQVHPDDRAAVEARAIMESTEKGWVDSEGVFRILMPDGRIKHLHSMAHPVRDAEDNLAEVVGTIIDVTERRLAEQERERLRQALADLAHINRVSTMGELTASLSHEIKQPIAAAVTDARTCMRWLSREQPNLAEAHEAAARLIKDVTRASDIISRIGSLFKKEAAQWEYVNVNDLVLEMVALVRMEAARYAILVKTDLAPSLTQVLADRVQLQQVFMNLMLNGIEAMKDLETPGRLTITSRQLGNRQLQISVTDTGVGLPAEAPEKIFEAFVTSKSQGTGMGLPISRSIIESHGGRLWATPNAGPGATFQFTLPLEASAHQTA